jgi:hypothetical protein
VAFRMHFSSQSEPYPLGVFWSNTPRGYQCGVQTTGLKNLILRRKTTTNRATFKKID